MEGKMNTRYFHFDPKGTLSESADAVVFLSRRERGTEAGFAWIDCCGPERIELEDIAVNFGLHRLSVDDCFEESPIPKIDVFPEYCALVFNDVIPDREGIRLSESNFFLGRDFLLSVRRAESEGACPVSKFVERIGRNGVPGGPAMLLHSFLDEAVDRVFPAIEDFADRISEIEDGIATGAGFFDAGELSAMRRSHMALRKSLNYERELVSRIRRRESPLFGEATLPYFGDLYDHLASYLDLAESNREMLGNLMQMNLTMSNNSMAEASNRMNLSVRRLTFITVIFMPLTLISGIFGMSEFTMMTGPGHWKIAYPLLALGMVGIAAITARILRGMDARDGK